MMSGTRRRNWSAVTVALAVTVSAAAMTATEAITKRHKAMEGIGKQMGTLAAIAKKEQPFDAEVVKASAEKIAGLLKKSAELFPEGSDTGDAKTWAKPEVWTDREKFDKLFKSSHQAAVDIQSVIEAEAFPAALGALGNSCKTCHDAYRLPKK